MLAAEVSSQQCCGARNVLRENVYVIQTCVGPSASAAQSLALPCLTLPCRAVRCSSCVRVRRNFQEESISQRRKRHATTYTEKWRTLDLRPGHCRPRPPRGLPATTDTTRHSPTKLTTHCLTITKLHHHFCLTMRASGTTRRQNPTLQNSMSHSRHNPEKIMRSRDHENTGENPHNSHHSLTTQQWR